MEDSENVIKPLAGIGGEDGETLAQARTKITLYSQFELLGGQSVLLLPTHFDGVAWQEYNGIAASSGRMADTTEQVKGGVRVIIPFSVKCGKTYLPPSEFLRVPRDEVDQYWTLTPGNHLIKGHITKEYSRTIELEKALGMDNVRTILKVHTADYGSPSMHHYEVSGR